MSSTESRRRTSRPPGRLRQLALPFAPTREASSSPSPGALGLQRQLEELTEGRVRRLTLTRNRSTILSASPLPRRAGFPRGVHLRIHQCFVDADRDVLQAVADFAVRRVPKQQRTAALAAVRAHFDEHAEEVAPPRTRRRSDRGPQGRVHDLSPMVEELNTDYFAGALELNVTWGSTPRRRRRRRRTIQLGSYQDETATVRIHPVLDHREVPRYVVEAVLHHEMLHAVVPAEPAGSRRRVHTDEFRRREREFRHHDRAERWLAEHLFGLMERVERQLSQHAQHDQRRGR